MAAAAGCRRLRGVRAGAAGAGADTGGMMIALVLSVAVALLALVHWYVWRRTVRDVSAPGSAWRRIGTGLAVLLPPLAVHRSGRTDLVPLSVGLTLCLWVPGAVHAWHVVGRAAWEREQQFIAAFQHHVRH